MYSKVEQKFKREGINLDTNRLYKIFKGKILLNTEVWNCNRKSNFKSLNAINGETYP